MSDTEFSGVKRWLTIAARIIVGAVFVCSGCAKMIDLWGFTFKIQDYLAVWHIDVPQALVVAGGGLLSMAEFITGVSMALGCYRRIALYVATAMMAFMLPLTVYIAIANPVADCGCFGDWLVISNGMTVLKNTVITALIGWLWVGNSRVAGVIPLSVQWVSSTFSILYMVIVGIVGFQVQPLVDFRPYPDGRSLVEADVSDDGGDDDVRFIYEKDGVRRSFATDSLPDDTWIFVDREGDFAADADTTFPLYDEDGSQSTLTDVIDGDTPQMLVLIPDMTATDPSMTATINDLNDALLSIGGSLTAIIGSHGNNEIPFWRDFALASYPVYLADPIDIKIMARGAVALVMVDGGTIYWKRTLGSIDSEAVINVDTRRLLFDELRPRGAEFFKWLTLGYIVLQLFVALPGGCVKLFRMIRRK